MSSVTITLFKLFSSGISVGINTSFRPPWIFSQIYGQYPMSKLFDSWHNITHRKFHFNFMKIGCARISTADKRFDHKIDEMVSPHFTSAKKSAMVWKVINQWGEPKYEQKE